MADVVDRDLGWKRIMRDLTKADGAFTKVGVQEGEIRGDGTDLVIVAAANEFGAPKANILERSFIRSTADAQRQKVERLKEGIVKRMIDRGASLRIELGLLGEFMEKEIKNTIIVLRTPPNLESTKKRKGSDNPLVDKGQLHQSIRHVEVIP